MLKFRLPTGAIDPVMRLVSEADGKVLSGELDSFVITLTHSEGEIDRFISEASRHGELLEVVRSGALAIGRGSRGLQGPR